MTTAYNYERMLEDAEFLKRPVPWWGQRKFYHTAQRWGCFLRWLRWNKKNNAFYYTFYTAYHSDGSKQIRAIKYIESKP